jgi:hypothetical protein
MSERFTDSGMLKIPTHVEEIPDTEENREKLTIKDARCLEGNSLMDPEHSFEGKPGIKLGFRRPNGEEGLFVVSPFLHDTRKTAISGTIVEGEKVTLFCPSCGKTFPILAACDRCKEGEMVLIHCGDSRNVTDAVSFCNVFGCPNAMFVMADRVIRGIEKNIL